MPGPKTLQKPVSTVPARVGRPGGSGSFEMVNGDDTTWTWQEDSVHCSGQPVGVTRSKKQLTNFELVVQWRHLTAGGNSGVFCWVPERPQGVGQGEFAADRD